MAVLSYTERRLEATFNGERLVVEPWGANSLRVRSRLMGPILDTDYSLLEQKAVIPEIRVSETEGTIVNGNIKAVIRLDQWHKGFDLSFYNHEGETLLEEVGACGALNFRSRKFGAQIGGDHSLSVTFKGDEDEKLYGMGQYQQPFLDLKHCQLELAHRNSQASIPFVLSSKGYGFFWHSPAIGHVNFGKNVTEWHSRSTQQMDYWITAADRPAQIVEAYAGVTGKVPMMPDYGMGLWQCKLRYYNQEQLLEVAREYHRREIPLDVIVCDFFHWTEMGDFKFDKEFFPDPKAMVDELKAMECELMVSVWPQIAHKSENYESMKDKNLLVKSEFGLDVDMLFGGRSVYLDATNPEARDFVWEKCRQHYYDAGIRIFWLDEAEPEYGSYDFENYRYHMGPNLQIGNIYPQQFSKAFYEGMEGEGQDQIVNLVRCAWSGSQRYGALVWSGDIQSSFEAMRHQIHAGLHMGISGIPWWTTDIGGFHGGDPNKADFRELFLRWFQYGTFCPVMRIHGDRHPHSSVYNDKGEEMMFTGADNELWSYGEEAYKILLPYVHFREVLRPYTRDLMEAAHLKGTPVMRTMFYEFPLDEEAWSCEYQYMYGPDLLVAPITEKDSIGRRVYLPSGQRWTDLYTGQVYEGGQSIEAQAPLKRIPLYIKGKAHEGWIGLLP